MSIIKLICYKGGFFLRKIFYFTGFFCVCVILIVAWTINVSNSLETGIVRLHILANSDSDFDQSVKVMVRDAVTQKAAQLGRTPDEQELLEIANGVLKKEGADYSAKVDFGKYNITRRSYEGFILPEGKYTAAKVSLGQGKGKNWWCVLSPPLCFSKSALGETDSLSKNLNYEANSAVSTDGITVKLKSLELASKIKEKYFSQQK